MALPKLAPAARGAHVRRSRASHPPCSPASQRLQCYLTGLQGLVEINTAEIGASALLTEVSAHPAVPSCSGARAQAWEAIREVGRHSPAQFALLAVPQGSRAEPDNAVYGVCSDLAGGPGGESRAALGAGVSVGAAGVVSATPSERPLPAAAGAPPVAAAGLEGCVLWHLMDAYSTDVTGFVELELDAQVAVQQQKVRHHEPA